MGVQYRFIVPWTGCAAAATLEDGHVLHTSTLPTLLNSVQVIGHS